MNHDQIVMWIYENAEKIGEEIIGKKIYSLKRQWEYPLTDGKTIKGYIDLSVVAEHEEIKKEYKDNQGYEWESCINETIMWFEAKTKIESAGELFRQLIKYRSYARIRDTQQNKIIVVCSDTKYKKLIEDQGYLFIQPFSNQSSLLL